MQAQYVSPKKAQRQEQSRNVNDHIAATTFNQRNLEKDSRMNEAQSNQLQTHNHSYAPTQYFSSTQIEILKNSICKGASDEEFQIFLMACQKTQLDPFMKQIHAVKRWDNRLRRETMTIQTGIDGYRLIAERTEKYAPGPKPTYEYDADGNLISATAYVKKLTKDGTWHVVEAEAFLDEYCQTTLDKNTGEKKAIGMWNNMQRNQLAKCAESLALRKAFPAEMSGVYTKEEMKQAEFVEITPKMSVDQIGELEAILSECDDKYRLSVYEHLKKVYGIISLSEAPLEVYDRIRSAGMKNMEVTRARKMEQISIQEETEDAINE